MWDVLLLFSSICTAVVVGAADTVTGHRRERVEIRCPYEPGYESNSKYFCRGDCLLSNNIMVESGSPAKDERFSLTDDKKNRVFTVTITDLRAEDQGKYRCAVKRTFIADIFLADVYSEILLQIKLVKQSFNHQLFFKNTVVFQHNRTESTIRSVHQSVTLYDSDFLNIVHLNVPVGCSGGIFPVIKHLQVALDKEVSLTEITRTKTGNTTVELHQPTTKSVVCCLCNIMCNIISCNIMSCSDLASVAGGLGSVLLVLTLCSGTFLILKKRNRKCGTALVQQNVQHNTETDRMYEEIPNSDVAAVTSSSNQTPASHLGNLPEVSTVYTTVTNQQPDSNLSHTHSTNQVTDPDCDYYAIINSPDPTQDSRTEVIYVTATHPQNISTNEGTIYSVIKHE
ncbi:uncharacterized protein LOC125273093 [Megalobrama amblycephala]|uniref:uncharacterized protein LOC125273093 n=1 Tax=Megalobrama amblycephala TaxID=75352 RepID=UPI0020142AAE|nr:uncharacterized protein LOC125273093 [Megalobrama amblycephala]